MGGLLFGYEIGVIGQVLALHGFDTYFGLSELNTTSGKYDDTSNNALYSGLITAMFLLGCVFGAGIFTFVVDTIGRKKSIIIGGILFAAGGTLQSAAQSLGMLIVGRLLSGLAIGTVSMVTPIYLAETAPTTIRGAVTTVYQLMITFGIFVATCVNSIIIKSVTDSATSDVTWRAALGAQIIPSILLVILVSFIPYSPRWLCEKARNDEGLQALAKLRETDVNNAEVIAEYKAIRDHVEFEQRIGQASWSEFLQPGLRRRLIIGFFNQFFQQFTGINVILYYGSTLFKYMGFGDADTVIAFPLANAFINFMFTFPGMWGVDRVGRRPLLLWGGVVQGIAHLLVFVFLTVANNGNQSAAWGAIIAIYLFLIGFASTWGPVVWSYQAEIFPLRVRAKGAGIATMSNWAWNFVIAFLWPIVFDALNKGPPAYLIFSAFCFASAVWTYFAVPETRGKSLEEIDEVFGDNSGAMSGGVEVGLEKK